MPAEVTEALAAQGIELEPGDGERLRAYLALLYEANERFNLTAIKDPAEAWTKHIQDSLSLLPFLASAEVKTVIDVGSGGGLPGIPLAIAFPAAHFTLLEATGKKAAFLSEAVQALGLTNATVVNERAETAGQDHRRFREQFDATTSRAVGPLAVLLELTIPFLREGGHALAIKGERAAEEVAACKQVLHLLHSHCVDTVRTPTGTVVVVEKQRKTPRVYPRLPGEPKRKPLH